MRDGATAAVGSKRCQRAVDQRLGPGVRVGLADDHVVAARIDLAALVAGDHARRNPGGAQQHDERAGVVLAEAAPRVEQEAVDRRWRRAAAAPACRRTVRAVNLCEHRVDERRRRRGAPRGARAASASVRGWLRAKLRGSCRFVAVSSARQRPSPAENELARHRQLAVAQRLRHRARGARSCWSRVSVATCDDGRSAPASEASSGGATGKSSANSHGLSCGSSVTV